MSVPTSPNPPDAVRLSKRVAALVPCSRSDAERYIDGGWVRVDGAVVDEPQARVEPHQAVTLDPGASLLALAPLTVLLHQPAGEPPLLPTLDNRWPHEAGGQRVTRGQLRQLQPLMPLPGGAGGLAVYSQDRRILRRLTEDAAFIEQELVADVTGTLAEGGLARLARGLPMEGRPLPPVKASWQSERRLRLAFKALPPQAVPWLCEQVGLQVTQLRRLRLGRLPLAGLPAGQWRALQPHERF
ncbi:RNA pseudouridine synthase [Ramlibacter sp. MAHUQ-53]|uniref:RNA pseudouridine synthase n=1 Tax=unclassified Ramlibacter TaxID=2617605 RepID=UPI003638C97F